MKPFVTAIIISILLVVIFVVFEPQKLLYHNIECTGGIGGGCDTKTAKGVWSWLAK